ncbi:ankyrin repeat domain-containing protein, partial [Acinetobacter baumannii]
HHQKNLTALNTLLLDAAKQGSIEMVHLLHAYGGDLNKAQTRDKKNLMQIASEAGHVALLEYLSAPHQDPRFSIDASNTKKLSLHKPDF